MKLDDFPTEDEVRRFWLKVKKGPACWLWTASCNCRNGYPQFRAYKTVVWAHRFSYRINCGIIPRGMEVMHECDTPKCVNPAHLKVGTHKQNMEGMAERNRSAYGASGRQPNAKLTMAKAEEIRAKYKTGNYSMRELGEEYGVDGVGTLGPLIRYKTWVPRVGKNNLP